ncbi:MAG: MFS transporter [Alphaproteobacteria bacterium]|nr:MFS transporter [Alphaproteobacteria bacterium]MBN2779753.1 MFS transporter [Alphaproteobacteria bacterium]
MHKLPELSTVEKNFGLIGGIIATASSAYGIILPLVIRNISQSDQTVGYYYTILAALGFLVSIFSTYLFSSFNKVKVFRINIFISLIVLFTMTALEEHISFYIVDLIRALCLSISGMSITLMIKEMVKKRDIKQALAKYTQYAGLGGMAGAFAGGYVAKYFGNSSIFIVAGTLIGIALILFLKIPIRHKLNHFENEQMKKIEKRKISPFIVFKYFSQFFTDTNKRSLYLLSTFRGISGAIFGVYFPITIIRLQYNQEVIGNIKVGLTLLGLLVGSKILALSDKYKFSHLFFIGCILMGICTFGFSIFSTFETVFILFGFMVFFRIPSMLTEEVRDQYFFSTTSNDDANKYFGIYKTGYQLGAIIGPLLGSALLSLSLFVFEDDSLDIMWIGLTILAGWTALLTLNLRNPR